MTATGPIVRRRESLAGFRTAGRVLAGQPALIALLAVCSFAAARYDTFLTPENLLNVVRQNSMAGLLALGMLLSILSGGIDLSLGALLAAGGVTAAALSPAGTAVAVAGALVVTGLLGLMNGLLVTNAQIQPFITTLVVNMTVRGMLLAVTADEPVRVARGAAGLAALGRGWFGPVPVPVLVLFAVYGLSWVLLRRARFGSHLLAAGENETASRLLGIDVSRVRMVSYAVGGCAPVSAACCSPGEWARANPTRD